MWRRISPFCLAGLLAAGLARAQGGGAEEEIFEDEIVREKTTPVIGVKIIRDNWKEVVGRKERGEIPVPASDVMETIYTEAPHEFLFGFTRVDKGFYSKAIEKSFEPTLKDLGKFRKVGGSPWPKQYCLYNLGVCHLRRGKKGDSTKARGYFERLIKEVPDSRFIFEAYAGVGDSLQVEGKYDEAAKAFARAQERFQKMAKSRGLTPDVLRTVRKKGLMAELRRAEMFDLAKRYDEVVSLYGRVASKAHGFPGIRFMARSGGVKAYVSLRQYDIAINKATDMIGEGEKQGHTEYLGGAYMALADCYFEKAGTEARPADLEVARYNYLRVATLYFGDERVVAKAQFRAGRCHERLATLPKGGEGRRAIGLAKRQYRLVVKNFPGTPWAAEAQGRLTALAPREKSKDDEKKDEKK